jgi:hypothetical protein
MENIFEGAKVRAVYSQAGERWLFSASDLTATLLGVTRAQGSVYWRSFKHRHITPQNEAAPQFEYDMVRFMASDGRRRMTEVIDIPTILLYIALIPAPQARPYKEWLAKVALNGDAEDQLIALGQANAAPTKSANHSQERPLLHDKIKIRDRLGWVDPRVRS